MMVRPICLWLLLTSGASLEQTPRQSDPAALALADFVDKSSRYQSRLEEYLEILNRGLPALEREVEVRREAVRNGLLSRSDLEAVEGELAAFRERLARQQMALLALQHAVVEVQASYQQLLSREERRSWFSVSGTRRWELDSVDELVSFFLRRFGRELPVSALGQTDTHLQLGFDHEGRLDVALHPDSPEGQALIGFLRQEGFPFTAFETPLNGSATGAHIHVGPPSPRVF